MDKGLKEKILKLFYEGKSYKYISKILNCSKGTISFHCSKLRIKKNDDRFSEENLKKYQKYYDEYKSVVKTANYFKIPLGSLRQRIKIFKKEKLTNESRSISNRKYVSNWRKRKKIRAVEYKGGKCQNCGYKKCYISLDFHHVNPKEKDFSISDSNRSWESTKKELDKCILVCRNCHGEIHEELHIKGNSLIVDKIIKKNKNNNIDIEWEMYIDKYQVNRLGQIRNMFTGRLLKPKINNTGYLYNGISINGKYIDIFPHIAVTETFIKEKPKGTKYVRHKDGNKQNNNVSNLEWTTISKYMKEAYEKDLLRIGYREVYKYSKDGIFLKKYDSILEASKDVNGCDSHINSCCSGHRKTHKGFIWKYGEKFYKKRSEIKDTSVR